MLAGWLEWITGSGSALPMVSRADMGRRASIPGRNREMRKKGKSILGDDTMVFF